MGGLREKSERERKGGKRGERRRRQTKDGDVAEFVIFKIMNQQL